MLHFNYMTLNYIRNNGVTYYKSN